MHGIYISKTGKRDKTFSESFQKHPALKRKKKVLKEILALL